MARKPRAFTVVRDPAPGDLGAPIDWSDWYLTEEDDVGQSPEQDDVVDAFASSLEQLVAMRGWQRVRVGRAAFFAWMPEEPNVRVAPDVYLLDDPPEPPWPKMWQTWQGHRPPRFALEVVSEDWKKDYEDAPPKYALLGTEELVIHDPRATRDGGSAKRFPLQVYRRARDGAFMRVYRGAGPVHVETLAAWLVTRAEGGVGWLRITQDANGSALIPTAAERAEQEAQRAEQYAARLRALGVDPDGVG